MRYRQNNLSIVARSADVSLGGMFLETPSPARVRENFTVIFCAEGFPVEIDSTVVYESSSVGIGVRFRHINDDDREYLATLIESRRQGH